MLFGFLGSGPGPPASPGPGRCGMDKGWIGLVRFGGGVTAVSGERIRVGLDLLAGRGTGWTEVGKECRTNVAVSVKGVALKCGIGWRAFVEKTC